MPGGYGDGTYGSGTYGDPLFDLPGNVLQWTQVVPGSGQTFVAYHLYRDGVRIAVIADIGTTTYGDFTAIPGVAHTYQLKWLANISGDLVESHPAEVTATLVFFGAFLHDVAEPTEYADVFASALSVDSKQEIAFVRARGRRTPVAQVSEGLARTLSLTVHPGIHDDPERWRALESLQRRQYDEEAVLCLRFGHMVGERYFGQISRLQRGDGTALHAPSLELQETYYDEVR